MPSNTPIGDAILEEVVEGVIRSAFRASLDSWDMKDVKISCFWLGDENDIDNIKAKEPPFVFIQTAPNTDDGFFSPIRKLMVEVTIVTLQNQDAFSGSYIGRNVYAAIRRVFDTAGYLAFTSPVQTYAWRVISSNVGSGDMEGFEQATFTVELQVSIAT